MKNSAYLKKLVKERIKTLPPGVKISIGSIGSFTREDLIEHIDKNDKIGKKIIEVQLNYLQLLKEGVLLEDD